MKTRKDDYIDHEIRLRMVEDAITRIEKRFNKTDALFVHLESKITTQFYWVLGSIFTMILATITLFGGVILHLAKIT